MGIIAPDIGIDLGACNTLVYVAREGVVINEPTMVVVTGKKNKKRRVQSIGNEAANRLGRTIGDESLIRPISHDGDDVEAVLEPLLRYFIRRSAGKSNLIKPRVFITISSNMRNKARKELRRIAVAAGARKNGVYLVEKAFASAFGVGIDIKSSKASMVVDIGGASTEIGIVASKNFIYKSTLTVGGIQMDRAISQMILNNASAFISDRQAESIKMDEGSALAADINNDVFFTGMDNVTRIQDNYRISRQKVTDALKDSLHKISEDIKTALNVVGADAVSDIYQNGIYLTGGMSKLNKIKNYFEQELKIPIILATNPLLSAALGVGRMAEKADSLNDICDIDFLKEEEY